MTDGTHHSAVVGGSNCDRVIECPPSRLSNVPVVNTSSPDSERGTILHTAMEHWLAFGYLPDYVGNVAIEGELQEAAAKAAELFDVYLDAGGRIRDIHIEMKLHMKPIEGAFGTSDIVIDWESNKLSFVDWKFGVRSTSWRQLIFYAACAMYDKQTAHLFNEETDIELVIIQPSAMDGKVFKTMNITVMDIFDFIKQLKWAIDNGHDDRLLNSGEHCRYCPIKLVCPELARLAAKAQTWTDPHQLTPEQTAEAIEMADTLDGWISEVRKYAHERLNAGSPIPGYKLVPRRSQRKWKNEDEAIRWAKEQGLQYSQYSTIQLKSPAQLDKVLDVPEGLYEKRSSGTTVVRESDPREGVLPESALTDAVERLRAIQIRG